MESNFSRIKEAFKIGTCYCDELGLFVSSVAQTEEELEALLIGLKTTKLSNERLTQLLTNSRLWVGLGSTKERSLDELKKRLNEIDSANLIAESDVALPQLSIVFLEIVGHDFQY